MEVRRRNWRRKEEEELRLCKKEKKTHFCLLGLRRLEDEYDCMSFFCILTRPFFPFPVNDITTKTNISD